MGERNPCLPSLSLHPHFTSVLDGQGGKPVVKFKTGCHKHGQTGSLKQIQIISMQFETTRVAINRHGLLVSACQAQADDKPFTCTCPGHHHVKLVKPTGLEGKRPFESYFGHVVQPGARKRNLDGSLIQNTICHRGESEDHVLGKILLRDHVGQYQFSLVSCPDCDLSLEVLDTTGCEVALESRVDGMLWRYDCILKRNGENVAAMEVLKTHETTQDKIRDTKLAGLPLAEFTCAELSVLADAGPGSKVMLKNKLVDKKPCPSCQAKRDQARRAAQARMAAVKVLRDKQQAELDRQAMIKDWHAQLGAQSMQESYLDSVRYAFLEKKK